MNSARVLFHTARWYALLALAPFKACIFLHPQITHTLSFVVFCFFLSILLLHSYLVFTVQFFSDAFFGMFFIMAVCFLGLALIWRYAFFGPSFSAWFCHLKLYPDRLSSQHPYYQPAKRFDPYIRKTLAIDPRAAIYILALHPLPPGSALSPSDLSPALLCAHRPTRELAVSTLAKLFKNPHAVS